MVSRQIYCLYREARRHQRSVRPAQIVYANGRVELEYASSPYGEHALAALAAAKRHAAFLARHR